MIQTEMSEDTYLEAKAEYDRRRALDVNHPEKMYNMVCWLKYYQMLDTGPLVKALDNCFSKFFELFRIDAQLYMSLASISFT